MIVIILTLISKVLAMISMLSRFLIVARKSNLRTRRNTETEIRVLKCP